MQNIIDQKQLENVESFNHLGNTITKDTSCTREAKSRLSWQRQHSARRRLFLPGNWT